MINYTKTTVLLLFLLCVTQLTQAENVESTDELKSSNGSKTIEHKSNVSESSTSKRLDKLENGKENVTKRTEDSAKGEEKIKRNALQDEIKTAEEEKRTEDSAKGEEKIKRNALQDEIKTAEEEKGNHTLSRRRRSHISEIINKYGRSPNQNSSETSAKRKFSLNFGNVGFPNFLKTFLDNSCTLVESYSTALNSMQSVLALMNNIGKDVKLDTDAIMSIMTNFKEVWEEYCNSPRNTKNVLDFFYNTFSKLLTPKGSDKDSVSQRLDGPSTVLTDHFYTDGDVMRKPLIFKLASKLINGKTLGVLHDLVGGKRSAENNQLSDILTIITTLFETYGSELGIPPSIQEAVVSQIKSLAGGKRSGNALSMLTTILDKYGDALNIPNDVKSVLAHFQRLEAGKGGHGTRSEGESNQFDMTSNYDEDPLISSEETGLARSHEDVSLEELLQKYCELSVGSSSIIMTLKALLKEFDVNDEPEIGRRESADSVKFLRSLKAIVDKDSDSTKRSGYEAAFIKDIMGKYCEGLERSNTALTSFSEVLDPQEGEDTRRSALFSSKKLLDEYVDGSKRSLDMLDFIKYFSTNCGLSVPQTKRLDSGNKNVDFQGTHARESVRPKVRTKSSKINFISGEQRNKRSEYDDTIAWRQGVFEPDKDQNVAKTQTEKSSPRIIKKSKIRRLKKQKNIKNRIINLYNGKENGTRTKGHRGPFSKTKIIGHEGNPSTSFQVKTGVEREMGSNASNPRFRCNVRTKASMSDADGRTGSSKGNTFSEVSSNDTKALLCNSETSEVHRPSKDVYIKQSVSGKSIVSYDNPDKYIRPNYSPSKENLEIGTSGFSTLNDTSSKNQSISVVSTDSQNADSISRSDTKFVQGKGNKKGMESSANVEGSIDAIPNENPFITNSRQHSLGMIVENPDKNMESPLPVEKNEKLQTYSKFQRTEDFDINFRMFNPERYRPQFRHRRRPR